MSVCVEEDGRAGVERQCCAGCSTEKTSGMIMRMQRCKGKGAASHMPRNQATID